MSQHAVFSLLHKFCYAIALLMLVAVPIAWILLGADMGWSKTQVQILRVDPVTELEFPEWHNQFVPGLDFLIAGLAASGAFAALGFFFAKFGRRQSPPASH